MEPAVFRVLALSDFDAMVSNPHGRGGFHKRFLSLVRGGSFRRGYSLGAHGAAVKRPVCDVRHIPVRSPAARSAISAATESGVSRGRSTTIGTNPDGSPATNAFVRNARYASVTLRGS